MPFLRVFWLSITMLIAFPSSVFANEEQAAVKIENATVENFYRVSDELYRSGQPSADQMKELERFGIKTVLNLRQYNSDDKEAKGTAPQLFHVKMNAGRIYDKDVIEALTIIRDAPKPVLIHCWHGSDRTGVIVAMYRIVFQNWTKEAAIAELKQPQFGHHERTYRNIPKYLESVDVEAMRQLLLNK